MSGIPARRRISPQNEFRPNNRSCVPPRVPGTKLVPRSCDSHLPCSGTATAETPTCCGWSATAGGLCCRSAARRLPPRLASSPSSRTPRADRAAEGGPSSSRQGAPGLGRDAPLCSVGGPAGGRTLRPPCRHPMYPMPRALSPITARRASLVVCSVRGGGRVQGSGGDERGRPALRHRHDREHTRHRGQGRDVAVELRARRDHLAAGSQGRRPAADHVRARADAGRGGREAAQLASPGAVPLRALGGRGADLGDERRGHRLARQGKRDPDRQADRHPVVARRASPRRRLLSGRAHGAGRARVGGPLPQPQPHRRRSQPGRRGRPGGARR